MINILYIIDTTGPGGAETLFIELNKHFLKKQNNGLAVIHGSGFIENKLQENNIEYIIIPGKGAFNFKLIFHLIKLIFTKKINVIHAHLFGSNIYASIAGFLTNTPVISTFHGLVDIDSDDKLLKLKIYIIKKASTVVAVSEKILDNLIKTTPLTSEEILLIPNGIKLHHPTKFNNIPLKQKYNISDSSTIIGCLGNVRPAKDYATAINTIKLLRQQNINVTLLIAGATNHPLYEEFLDKIKLLNLTEHIHFIGFIDDPFNFLSSIDIYLMSSSTEGQPISLFQAMSSNLPIVGTRCGIEDVLINGETAWLSPVASAESLASHIISIMNDKDEATRRALNAVNYVNQHFNINSMFLNYQNLYHNLTI